MSTTFKKSNYSWYGISILQSSIGYDIILLFKDIDDGYNFFNLVTKDNNQPSFYCFLQVDKTHSLKIDFSNNSNFDEFIITHFKETVQDYPPITRLKENHQFRIVIGTEQTVNRITQTLATSLTWIPKIVKYVSQPYQQKLQTPDLN